MKHEEREVRQIYNDYGDDLYRLCYFYTGNVKLLDGDYDYILTGREQNTIHLTSSDGFHFSGKELVLANSDYPDDMTTHVRDPKILILDEATANIDTQTEMMIQHGMNQMRKGRTTIAIAHRLSTLRKANRILVVDKGEIIENGSHDELMALKGKYYKLIQIQSMSQKIRAEKEAENFE